MRSKGGELPGQDNGDHVLMDFRCGFFAVSDSLDRNPVFSRDFLLQFSDRLRDIPEKSCTPTCLILVHTGDSLFYLEKIYQKMQLEVSKKPPVVQKLFGWAERVGGEVSQCKEKKILFHSG